MNTLTEQKQSPKLTKGSEGPRSRWGWPPISLLFPPVLHQLVFLL